MLHNLGGQPLLINLIGGFRQGNVVCIRQLVSLSQFSVQTQGSLLPLLVKGLYDLFHWIRGQARSNQCQVKLLASRDLIGDF